MLPPDSRRRARETALFALIVRLPARHGGADAAEDPAVVLAVEGIEDGLEGKGDVLHQMPEGALDGADLLGRE